MPVAQIFALLASPLASRRNAAQVGEQAGACSPTVVPYGNVAGVISLFMYFVKAYVASDSCEKRVYS